MIDSVGLCFLTSRCDSQDCSVVICACAWVTLEDKLGRNTRRDHILQISSKDSNGGGVIAPIATVHLHGLVRDQISEYFQNMAPCREEPIGK